jgi:hypothetical protein
VTRVVMWLFADALIWGSSHPSGHGHAAMDGFIAFGGMPS